jgi:hypothetical protein
MAATAASGLAIAARLAPIRKGARILREISWRWREIGAESRICDSIDSQVDAIQESCRQLAKVDTTAALASAFELMRARIEALAEENGLPVPPTSDAAADAAAAAAAKLYAAAPDVPVASSDDTLGCARMPATDAAVHEPATPAAATGRAAAVNLREEPLLGILPDTDPVAAIRRMSLADKIAFFS